MRREGWVVKTTKGDRRYVCPHCGGTIEPGAVHLVAYPEDRLSERRHYHKGCLEKAFKSGRPISL